MAGIPLVMQILSFLISEVNQIALAKTYKSTSKKMVLQHMISDNLVARVYSLSSTNVLQRRTTPYRTIP